MFNDDKKNDYVTELQCIDKELVLLISRLESISDEERDALTAPIYHLKRVIKSLDEETVPVSDNGITAEQLRAMIQLSNGIPLPEGLKGVIK